MGGRHDRGNKSPPRVYRYVLKGDSGMAPNPRGGFISLATCKPKLRCTAGEGDWVIGNYPSPHNQRIAWAGKIERTVSVHDYSTGYPSREDALYRLDLEGELERIPGKNDWYHRGEEEQRKDKEGRVLVFDPRSSWYFGEDGRPLPDKLHHLIAFNQGHRVKDRRPGDLDELLAWLHEQAPPGIHGEPRDGWAGPDEPAGSPCGPRRTRRPRRSRASCATRRTRKSSSFPRKREPSSPRQIG
jgi:hypothetical protein